MHDLTLAHLIHQDREREIARDQRAAAVRKALSRESHETFIPSERPTRITHPLRPASDGGRMR